MNSHLLFDWLTAHNINPLLADTLTLGIACVYLVTLALLSNYIAKRFICSVIHPLIHKSVNQWDDALIDNGVFIRFSHWVPAAAIKLSSNTLFSGRPVMQSVLETTLSVYLIIITLWIIDAVLNFIRHTFESGLQSKRFPAKSFIQASKLVINLVGCILILSTILDKSPLVFFSGLGAITAILLLIFKDAILGLVAGFQLSLNQMVMVGDWIEMPARGADGDVIDVSLTTVKVRNWDKTITTIPTYALISDSFKNWRGMSESGGRRIKRPIHVDMRTIQFANEELLERFKRIRILRPYLEQKLEDIQKYNASVGDDLHELISGRRLTNIGTFRAYCLAYLRQHPKVHKEMTLLVRQLAPSAQGLPIEIYVFTNDTAWASYEDIQADIFDHFLSILPEFELSAYQSPSGADLEKAGLHLKSL